MMSQSEKNRKRQLHDMMSQSEKNKKNNFATQCRKVGKEAKMNQDFECAYKNAKDKRKKSERIRIEKIEKPKEKFGLLKKIFLSKKYNDSLVKKLSAGELTVAQLKQINRAIKSGLSDRQLNSIINSKKDAGRMAVIIDIAINVNKMSEKEAKY